MKKISFFAFVGALGLVSGAIAVPSGGMFRDEVRSGIDVVGARTNVYVIPDEAPGEMGLEVYQYEGAVDTTNTKMFIPASMYMRMGGGLNIPFATDRATFDGKKYKPSGGYSAQIGLGWNASSYVRTEIDFQTTTMKFSDLTDLTGTYRTLGGMLYFDFARRYILQGDITHRRRMVPFMGLGAALGQYQYDGADGADGFLVAAPRGVLGLNVMLNDMIGVDIMYQYQMMIGKYGWNEKRGVSNVSNLMASLRVNF